MQKESAVIALLAAQQREWRTRFPGLTNRAHQANVGYLCTESSYAEGGYEPVGSYKGYLQPAKFRPDTEHLLVDTAVGIAGELKD